MCRVGIVILAAGASTRMGMPKQLLTYRGVSLVRHAASTAMAAGCGPVVVVLGANAERIQPELEGLAVTTVLNPHWESGMGSSIHCGLGALTASAEEMPGAAILMLCDQPHIPHELLAEIAREFCESGCRIVACEYGGTTGVPALFSAALFPELMQLPAAAGAKPLIMRYADQIVRIPCPEASADIDTPADYERVVNGDW